MMGTSRKTGFAFLAAAMVGVGSTVVAGKIIGAGMPPFTATSLRFAISSPVFAVLLWRSGEPFPRLSARDWALLLAQSAAGSVAYTVLTILGLSFTSAGNAGVILGTLPVAMGVLAIAAFGEPATKRFLAAIAAAVLGVLMVTVGPDASGAWLRSSRDAVGIAVLLAAVVCEALFLLLNKKLEKPVPALTLSTVMSVFGLALAIGPAGLEMAVGGWKNVTGAAVIGVVYYALVPTVFGFLLWYEGAARTSAQEAALFTAVLPVSALALAALVLGEPITARQAVGCLCVLGSILFGVSRPAPGCSPAENEGN